MLSFTMFINFNKSQFFKTIFLATCLMFCLSSQATNFYVGFALSPTYLSIEEGFAGTESEADPFDDWLPYGAQVHVGIEQELLHFQEEDPEWGHANLGIGGRLFVNLVLTGDRFGGSSSSFGLEPYVYLTPSSQLGLKLYVGSGFISDDLVATNNSFFWGGALAMSESLELFFDMRSKASNGFVPDKTDTKATNYNIGVNFKF